MGFSTVYMKIYECTALIGPLDWDQQIMPRYIVVYLGISLKSENIYAVKSISRYLYGATVWIILVVQATVLNFSARFFWLYALTISVSFASAMVERSPQLE